MGWSENNPTILGDGISNAFILDDIDLATNITPLEVCEILKKNNISFYETGIEHGTVTAKIDNYKFAVCNLIKDLSESYQTLVRKKTAA